MAAELSLRLIWRNTQIPDMAAEPERLAKGEPALSGETVLDDRTPQDQQIPEYPRCVAALRGMASDALIAVAHGGRPPAWR